jgi:hypothetical protein
MKVTWTNAYRTTATVQRGLFRKQVAEVRTDSHRFPVWWYASTGRRVEDVVARALNNAEQAELESTEWVSPKLPTARVL